MYTGPMQIGSRVTFQLRDVACPSFEQMVAQLDDGLAVEGEIMLLSDRGLDSGHFAVVAVPGINMPVVVPFSAVVSNERSSPVVAEAG